MNTIFILNCIHISMDAYSIIYKIIKRIIIKEKQNKEKEGQKRN